ncbi:low-specificity L-threonine aldolase [Aurantibacillus circumpalustris]|uniref:low-specificity L-threonine aldolase n=1 Tax=Aurantibacillus circumpalustris TaxID=3036359 RepID=UPI00295A922E|nr:low-specificity L-threonine aldolase [Aurantibacillus circumpalustris]
MEFIDLRSDTVTKPSALMLEAMMTAKVGDDVFNEDPTVIELENYAANLFGKEAALYCPSGTMTNQIAIKVHTQPGDEVICDVNSHIFNYEGGGISFNSGVQARLIQGNEGRISAEMIEPCINGDFDWLTKTSLVSLENTVNRAGGSFYTKEQIKPVYELCRDKNLKLHLDGARIFNALVETGDTPKEIGNYFHSISICLSKGLGAPVGSLLLGDKDFIKKARRYRKVFGGGMRQAGFLAAAGLYALKNNITRLKEDHLRAKKLEQVLRELPFVESILPVYTNILIFNLKKEIISGEAFEKKLRDNGIKISSFGKQTIRFVTHLDYTDDMLARTIQVLKYVC